MTFSELIQKRKSLRKYAGDGISKEKLTRCLEAARLAPSACNAQPWKFITVDDKELKDKLCRAAFSGAYSMNKFASDAPVIVVVVSDKQGFIRKVGSCLKGTDYYLIDIGIACEHLILQASEMGIGSCWLGWFNERAVKKVLGIPRPRRVDVMISLGYPAGEVPPVRPRKQLGEMSSFNRY